MKEVVVEAECAKASVAGDDDAAVATDDLSQQSHRSQLGHCDLPETEIQPGQSESASVACSANIFGLENALSAVCASV